MPKSQFRWNRKTYMRAQHLHRLLNRLDGYGPPPTLVQRFRDFWAQVPSRRDPLTIPLGYRYDRDELPF